MGINLTTEQQKIVDYSDRLLVLKGAAGSGKTLVGLCRANKMAEDRTYSLYNSDKKVVFLTFNNSLVNDLKDKYEEQFGKIDSSKIEFMTYDKFMFSTIRNTFLDEHPGYNLAGFSKEWYRENRKQDKFNKGDNSEYVKFIREKIRGTDFSYYFISDEFEYIIANNFTREEYLVVPRKNRKIRLGKNQRSTIYDILEEYRKRIESDERADSTDMYNWFLNNFLNKYVESKDYEGLKEQASDFYNEFSNIHSIIIDESQDLNKTKILIMLRILDLFPQIKAITFLYDVAQTIYQNSCFGSITSFKSIGIDGRRNVRTLSFSYRSTRQIHMSAYSLLSKFQEKDNTNELLVNPVFAQSDEGVKPFLVKFNGIFEEAEVFAKTIKNFLETHKYTYSDILVIPQNIRSNDIYIKALEREGIKGVYLDADAYRNHNLKAQSAKKLNKNAIRFCNPYNAKGLEAKIVFMLGTDENSIRRSDEEVAKYYYVQMTRAMEYLFIFSFGEPNRFIQSIDEQYITEIEYDNNLSFDDIFDDIIKDNTIANKDNFKGNKVERFEKVKEKEIEEEEKEREKELEEKSIKADKKIERSASKMFERDSCIERVQEQMAILPKEVIEFIGMGLYYYEEGVDIEIAYLKFSKGLEFIIREIYNEDGLGLGTMLNALLLNKDYKKFVMELYKRNIVKARNKATHETMNSQKQLDTFYEYIFKENGLVKLYDKYLKVNKRDRGEDAIEKIGNGYKVKVGGKELYSYLIDNEEYAVCKQLFKSGEYKIKGNYQLSRGEKIFVVNEYQKVA